MHGSLEISQVHAAVIQLGSASCIDDRELRLSRLRLSRLY